MGKKIIPAFAVALLIVVITAAYAKHFHNGFHFDDAHTIVNNVAIQSLRNIPHFFTDATTFSSLPSNQSYRPLVSTLFAIDYAIGRLNPLPFHLSIFALFVALVLLIGFLIYRLTNKKWIAFGAAALYGLHPANADTVNYIVASAEIISTLGIVASFAIYFAFPNGRCYFLFVLPAAIGILAKPPAAIFPVLLATYLVLFPESRSKRWLVEIAVPFVICSALLLVVQHLTPASWVAGARDAYNYVITQPYVTLLYFKTFFWPTDLSADYDLNPFTSTNDPRFWAGTISVVLLVAMSILCARSNRTRVIGFGLLWFLISLLPTSLFPLAEVMNDHRTFLPYMGLIIAFAGAISFFLQTRVAQIRFAKLAAMFAVLLILCASALGTFQRNKVWTTEETLWRDVTIKSPRDGRGLMNYGNTLMAKGDFNGALDYFHRALEFAPQYSVLFVNLGVAEDATKQDEAAEQHFEEAMRLGPASPDSYTYYARYLIARSHIPEARALLRRALQLSETDTFARDLIAQIGEPSSKESVGHRSVAENPDFYLARSLKLYNEGRYLESIDASRRALDFRPDYAEAWNNICAANNKLGRYQEAVGACEQALRLKPDFDLARNNLEWARQMGKKAGK